MEFKIDKKDKEILKVLDENYRLPLSLVGKKVGLSKNSVRLRFQRLKSVLLHSTVGIDNRMLGFNLVKVFYSVEALDNHLEEEISKELKKHSSVIYAAKFYGHYNLEVALFVKSMDELIAHEEEFNKKFSKNLLEKEVEITAREYFLRNNFLGGLSSNKVIQVAYKKRVIISKNSKLIISFLRTDPRLSVVDLSKKTRLSPKTVMDNMKTLEKQGVILGYFMMVDYAKFGLHISKLLMQTENIIEEKKFEGHLSSLKNIKHFSKLVGLWDYEADILYGSIIELHQQIESIKEKFPKQIKRIEIINHGKRLFTSPDIFLKD